ncbi:MAG: hypothetical protein PVF63_07205 [Gammaproteobacteria bacterium]
MLSKHLTGRSRTAADLGRADDKTNDLAAAIADRDAAIGDLEQTISEQREEIAKLRAALEQADFRAETLERSYSTQLGEARDRAAAAEESASDRQTRISELEASHKVLSRELADARATLASFGSDAASIDELLESFSRPRERAVLHGTDGAIDAPVEPETLEELLAPDVMFAGKSK